MKEEGGRMKDRGSTDSNDSSFVPHPSSLPAKRRFGQNFLVDRHVIDRIIASVNPRTDEPIIEIGPGRGALTKRLVQSGARVAAIEFDRDLAAQLREEFREHANFRLVEADALEVDFCEVIQPAKTARVVANLPYNIGTAILQRLIEQRSCIGEMTLMLQREVADRVTAAADSLDRGYLSVFVEAYCDAQRLFDV